MGSAMWETRVQSLDWEDPLKKGTATHSNILAWRIPQPEGSLAGYIPCGRKWSDTTEQFSLHFTPKEVLPQNTIWMILEDIMLINVTKDTSGAVLPWRCGSRAWLVSENAGGF